MAKVVLENRMRRRALRAQVAFAARCARRVQPLAMRLPADPRNREAVERAIRVAEEFARGNQVSPHTGRAAADAARAVATDAWAAKDTAASYAANAACYAANAAAAYTVTAGRDGATKVAGAAVYAYTDAAASARAGDARVAFDAASVSDLGKLARLKLGLFPELGAPIDPSESGPLGPLWPEGKPGWWQDYRTTEPTAELPL
jgi:hypothetical protein